MCFQRGESPLNMAAEHGYEGIVPMLLEAGADVNVSFTDVSLFFNVNKGNIFWLFDW